jgi:hypothetical protein
MGLVSRVTPVHTAMRNCTRDEGGPFEVGNRVLIKTAADRTIRVNYAYSLRSYDRLLPNRCVGSVWEALVNAPTGGGRPSGHRARPLTVNSAFGCIAKATRLRMRCFAKPKALISHDASPPEIEAFFARPIGYYCRGSAATSSRGRRLRMYQRRALRRSVHGPPR